MSDKGFDESKKGLSIAALVLGIISILISYVVGVGLLVSILAVIFGGICLNLKQGVKGFAITGLVLGIISLSLQVILILVNMGV